MKRPTVASLKKVSPENLAALGVERLADILMAAAEARPELKRRLRMELAAEQGADHLAPKSKNGSRPWRPAAARSRGASDPASCATSTPCGS